MNFIPEAEISRARRHFLALRWFYGDLLSIGEEEELFGRNLSWIERRFHWARRARMKPLSASLKDVWVARLRSLYASDADALAFLEAPHPAFGGKRTLAVIEAGRGASVETLLRQIEDGVYV